MDWPQLIGLLTTGPARVLDLDKGSLEVGADADVVLIDPDAAWTIEPEKFRSRCSNSPFGGWQVTGRVQAVFVSGELRFQRDESS